MASPDLVSVETKSGHCLVVRWADGSETTHDLLSFVTQKDWAAPLREPAVFARVQIGMNGREIAWPGTEIDISAESLWEEAHPRAVPAAPWMSADDFRAWLNEMDLTWDGAADALGISRRSVGNYLSGDQEIPKAVWLACMQLAAQRYRARDGRHRSRNKKRPRTDILRPSSRRRA